VADDLTAVSCGEDGWSDFCGVIDCFHRSLLSWTFTPRCRARDVSPALEHAFSPALLFTDEEIGVVVRHDNGTQFTSIHYRDVAHTFTNEERRAGPRGRSRPHDAPVGT
jgi:transposase InsO family protein